MKPRDRGFCWKSRDVFRRESVPLIEQGQVLVVGGSGQIGKQLVRLFEQDKWPVVGTYFRNEAPGLVKLDASEEQQISELFEQVHPTVVINAASTPGGTDACELEPDLAVRYHFGTGRNLADAAQRHGAKFIQISTDYVFDGRSGPYMETDPAEPLSRLGRAKLKLEEYILNNMPDALVTRTTFVFSWTPESKTGNFAMQIFDSNRQGKAMNVPVDQVGNVTYAPNFSQALVELIQTGRSGLYHLAGTTRCSKYDWALALTDYFGLDSGLIKGVTTQQLGQPAPRPLQAGFVLDKAQGVLQTKLQSLQDSLPEMRAEMGQEA